MNFGTDSSDIIKKYRLANWSPSSSDNKQGWKGFWSNHLSQCYSCISPKQITAADLFKYEEITCKYLRGSIYKGKDNLGNIHLGGVSSNVIARCVPFPTCRLKFCQWPGSLEVAGLSYITNTICNPKVYIDVFDGLGIGVHIVEIERKA